MSHLEPVSARHTLTALGRRHTGRVVRVILPGLASLASLASVLAFNVACSCGNDEPILPPYVVPAGTLTLTPPAHTLRPGEAVELRAEHVQMLPEDHGDTGPFSSFTLSLAPSAGLAELPLYLELRDDRGAVFPYGTPLRTGLCVTVGRTRTCTWRGSLSLAADAPPHAGGERWRVTAESGSVEASAEITLVLDPSWDAGPAPDAGTWADAGVDAASGSECGELSCLHGTLRTDDGCQCVCDPGWSGRTCADGTVMVETLAGNGAPGLVDGVGEAARLRSPTGLVVAPDGVVYIADHENDAIRAYDPRTGALSTLPATGVTRPVDLARAPDGTLYVSELGPFAGTPARVPSIRAIAPDGRVSVLPVAASELPFQALHVVGSTLYGSRVGGDRVDVARIDPGSGAVSTIAGNADDYREMIDGVGAAASFVGVQDIGSDARGMLVVVDGGMEGGLRWIDPATGRVTTSAGPFRASPTAPPARAGSSLASPTGVAWSAGAVYVAEGAGHWVRRLTAEFEFGFAEHVAGDRSAGSGDFMGERGFVDGDGETARFNLPRQVALSPDGSALYVLDTSNHALRVIRF